MNCAFDLLNLIVVYSNSMHLARFIYTQLSKSLMPFYTITLLTILTKHALRCPLQVLSLSAQQILKVLTAGYITLNPLLTSCIDSLLHVWFVSCCTSTLLTTSTKKGARRPLQARECNEVVIIRNWALTLITTHLILISTCYITRNRAVMSSHTPILYSINYRLKSLSI